MPESNAGSIWMTAARPVASQEAAERPTVVGRLVFWLFEGGSKRYPTDRPTEEAQGSRGVTGRGDLFSVLLVIFLY